MQHHGERHRHITISTVGIVPQIEQFADEGVQVNLAISLHAPRMTSARRSCRSIANGRWPS
jgi:23S rRNA (adenine2503-C2)-methyltransferase